jgi:hypothetical protein
MRLPYFPANQKGVRFIFSQSDSDGNGLLSAQSETGCISQQLITGDRTIFLFNDDIFRRDNVEKYRNQKANFV